MSKTPTTPKPELTREACITYLQAHGIYSGHSRDTAEQLRTLVADHQMTTQHVAEQRALGSVTGEHEAAWAEASLLLPDGQGRVTAAKAEHKALQAWIKAGQNPPKPTTPNLDAMNADYAAGKTAADRRKAAKGQRRTAERAPAPKPGQGYSVVELRNDKQATEVMDAIAGVQAIVQTNVDGLYLVVRNSEGQDVFDALVTATVGADIMRSRRLVLAQLAVRASVPKITDERGSLVSRLASALVAGGKDWSAKGAADSTPVFIIEGTEYQTARAAADAAGVPAKAPKQVAAAA